MSKKDFLSKLEAVIAIDFEARLPRVRREHYKQLEIPELEELVQDGVPEKEAENLISVGYDAYYRGMNVGWEIFKSFLKELIEQEKVNDS